MKRQPILLSLLFLLAALVLSAQPGHAARFLVKGVYWFEDGDPQCDSSQDPCPLGLANSFFRPARAVLLTVENRHGVVFGTGATGSEGEVNIAVDAPPGEALTLFAEVDNFALHVLHETDGANERYRKQVFHFTAGTSDVFAGFLFERVHYHQVRIDQPESTILPDTDEYTTLVSFSGALNINEVILQARETVRVHRDPREHETIDQVPVEYCDPRGIAQYFLSLTLSCAQVDGRRNNGDGLDDGYVDTTIAHEYTHHLQYEIGNWDQHFFENGHHNCAEIDTWFADDAEFAFAEGFPEFFAEHLAWLGDRN